MKSENLKNKPLIPNNGVKKYVIKCTECSSQCFFTWHSASNWDEGETTSKELNRFCEHARFKQIEVIEVEPAHRLKGST